MEAQPRSCFAQRSSCCLAWLLRAGLVLSLVCSASATQSHGQLLRRPVGRSFEVAKSRTPRYAVATEHFIVNAPDPVLAKKVGQEAERFRKELAIEWLGYELDEWEDKCPIQVEFTMHSGGETSFAFVVDSSGTGRPRDWKMSIFGTPERILDSVLPHEVTHTIFASHFGQPLPRWADEGACTVVEHESERAKNHQMLLDFLTNNRGIPFNRMFEMKQYPSDILPLYAQGHSLCKFLINQKGKRHFLDYVAAGMYAEQQGALLQGWNRSTEKFYGFRDLSDLQESWIAWVRAGSKESPQTELADSPNPNSRLHQTFVSAPIPKRVEPTEPPSNSVIDPIVQIASSNGENSSAQPTRYTTGSWYARQAQLKRESNQKHAMGPVSEIHSQVSGGKLKFQALEDLSREAESRTTQTNERKGTIWR